MNDALREFKNATDQLRGRFTTRQLVAGDVEHLLEHATPIDTYMRSKRLTNRAENDWSTLRTDLNTLAGAYNLSANWNGAATQTGYNSDSRLTGTFSLDSSRSYKEANTYSHLMNDVISGNPESLTADELHDRAWKIVAPHFQKAQDEALAKYHQLAGTGQTSTTVSEVSRAATGGRVASLFVAVGVQQWAAVGAGNSGIESHDEVRPGDADLLDLAATQTLMNRGEVFVVRPEMVPGETPLAAVFRY